VTCRDELFQETQEAIPPLNELELADQLRSLELVEFEKNEGDSLGLQSLKALMMSFS